MGEADSRIRFDYKPQPLTRPQAIRLQARVLDGRSRVLMAGGALLLVALLLLLLRIPQPGSSEVAQLAETAHVPAAFTSLVLNLPGQVASQQAGPASRSVADISAADASLPPLPSSPLESLAGAVLEPVAPQETLSTLTLTVRSGDSLDRLFRKNQLSIGTLHTIMDLPEARTALTRVMPGDQIIVQTNTSGEIVALQRRLDEARTLHIARSDEAYGSEIVTDELERRVVDARAVIDSSLFLAGRDAGVSDTLIMNLAGIYAWDIDFVLDIRVGDEFIVMYEQIWRDGEFLRDGDILAAEFTNAGDSYRAVRYTSPDGHSDYYTPDGLSMRKAFLRAPVEFSRISSSFNLRRKHPVLNTIRAHKGVDYAANSGTPVRAAGDGKVIFRGVKGGYGNCVILQHGGNITTLYAHLSRFARGVGTGTRVRQGQTIGQVGQTGLASGPHLHYEYRVSGVHRNPRTVKLPQADPIDAALRGDFDARAQALLTQLDHAKRTRLAARLQ